jgi:hypothetical protein
MSIPGNDLLAEIERDHPKLGAYFRNYVLPAIQTTARNGAVGTHSNIAPPTAPESVNVTTAGEMMQVVVNHSAPLQKGVHYIYHVATNPQFTNAQIEAKPATRAPSHFVLPTKDAGGNTHSYYVAVQTQYPGSPPSEPTFFGGSAPSAVNMAGTTHMDIQPGTGSGTATNGGQAFVGLGKAQVRL